MILPTKHIPSDRALLGIGATLLQHMQQPITVIGLWDKISHEANISTFENFVMGLDFLYILAAVEFREGLLCRTKEIKVTARTKKSQPTSRTKKIRAVGRAKTLARSIE